jgi:hypothetical protein
MASFGFNDAFELLQGVVSTTPATYSAATGVETIANNQRNGTHNLADFLSYSSSIVSSINAYASVMKLDSPKSNWTAIGLSSAALLANIEKIHNNAKENKDIKLKDVQNVIGDVFCLVGDVSTQFKNPANKAIGLELAVIGNGIKMHGAASFGNSTMPADELFNLKNWSGFGYDLLEQGSRKLYDLLEEVNISNPWKSENIIDPLNQNTPQFAQMGIQQQNQDFIAQGFAALLSDNPQQGMNQMLNSDYAKAFDVQAKQVLAQDEAQKQQELARVQEVSAPRIVRS